MIELIKRAFTGLVWTLSVRSGCARAYADGYSTGFEQGRKSMEEERHEWVAKAYAAGHAEGQQDLMKRMGTAARRQ